MNAVYARDRQTLIERRVTKALTILALTAMSLIVLLPLVWTISTSFRLPKDSFTLPPRWLPTELRVQNYVEVFEKVPFASYIVNSLKVTFSIVFGQVITSS